MTKNPQALGDVQSLRAERQQDTQAWSCGYVSGPASGQARAALQRLRQAHWNDMRDRFKE